jgi:UDP-N-acetyl-D-mannosaminuronic acid transferase (WecB/TagA/CpsF family)
MREPRRMAGRYLLGNPAFVARALVLRSRRRRQVVNAGAKP